MSDAKVVLRPLAMTDLDNIMGWVNDPDVIKNLANFSGRITREEEKAFLENILSSQNDKSYAVETYAVNEKDRTYIGNVGIHEIHWPSSHGRISVIIGNKDYWHRGYGSSAVRGVLDKGFDELGLHKLWLMVWKDNDHNKQIYRRLGFTEEGVLKDEYRHKGEYHDIIRMRMLEDEWRTIRSDISGQKMA